MQELLIEAETFESIGGWTIDTQCIEAMGSPYLLAHGIGRPVRDAETGFSTAESGVWHVYARTRDWTAVWGRGTPAGRFQILVDGQPLAHELGTNGPAWGWQHAGACRLDAGAHRLVLRDLTGFDGRCDAVFLTRDATTRPPDEPHGLATFRQRVCPVDIAEDPAVYDLIVCGGGFAGLCTALAAKRKGLKILVIQDRGVVGGCGSSEIRVWVGGQVHLPPYPALGNLAAALSPIDGSPGQTKDAARFEDDRKRLLFSVGHDLLLHECVIAVETDPADPKRIAAVVTRAVRTGRETRRRAALFVDCTGDALLARLTGCETMYGREARAVFNESLAPEVSDRMVMGHSTLWETTRRDHEVPFPDIDWGIPFDEENALARFNCCWDWETGQYRDQVLEIERIRDYGLMTCYANWSFLKNRSRRKDEWRHLELEWISPIGGKRESYRVCGNVILTQNDLLEHRPYEDGTASISWSIDIHYPDPENRRRFGETFQSCAYHLGIGQPYPVPYRCLYARDVRNLFLGGRCLSASQVAFSAIRVMRTLGMLGEVIGLAAAICRRHACDPREVYTDHLDELKEAMRQGVSLPLPCAYASGDAEAYHFMRPVGRCGNAAEDCWVRFNRDGAPAGPVPPELGSAITDLGLLHRNGRRYGE